MDLDRIKALIDLVGGSSVDELEVEENGVRIRVVRTVGPGVPAARSEAAGPRPSEPHPAPAPGATSPAGPLRAQLVGTFYRAPAPGEPPFVEIGAVVEAGQTLALIEAMKTLNPVEAERAGTVTEILADDGEAVEEGQPLFVVA